MYCSLGGAALNISARSSCQAQVGNRDDVADGSSSAWIWRYVWHWAALRSCAHWILWWRSIGEIKPENAPVWTEKTRFGQKRKRLQDQKQKVEIFVDEMPSRCSLIDTRLTPDIVWHDTTVTKTSSIVYVWGRYM